MPGSLGTVKLPIVSTFDPSGVRAAKQGMKELQGGPGGGAGGPPALPGMPSLPAPAGIAQRLGLGQAAKTLAGSAGMGGLANALGAAGPFAMVSGAVAALYALSQAAANNAIANKQAASAMGVSTKFYAGMEAAARSAGITFGEVTEGFSKFRGTLQAAAGGDLGTAAQLREVGLSSGEIAFGAANPETLVGRMGTGRMAGMIGSYRQAEALQAAQSAGGGMLDQNADLDTAATKLKTGGGNLLGNVVGLAALGSQSIGWENWGNEYKRQRNERTTDESRERWFKYEQSMREAGAKGRAGLMTGQEREGLTNETRAGYMYSGNFGEQQRYGRLAKIQAHEQRLSEEGGMMNGRDLYAQRIAGSEARQANGGYSNDQQAERDRQNMTATLNQQLRGTRSNAENLRADIGLSAEKWKTEDAGRAWKEVNAGDYDAADRGNLSSSGGKYFAHSGPITAAQTDIARDMGDKLTDAAEQMTHSGSLAGAYGANTVQGASQMIQAEYGMDQAKDTLRMVELLVKIAENTGRMTKDEGDAILGNLGFRTADPIFGAL